MTNLSPKGTDQKLFQELDPTPKQRVPKKVLDRNDFMLLFIKQLEYQDPMKPLDNNEMATQLALFNQVDQLFSVNQKLEDFMKVAKNQEMVVLTSLIGRLVKVKGELGRVENGRFLGAKLKVEEPVSRAKVKIFSSDGRLVRTINLGGLSPGEHEISWDAKDENGQVVPDGNYRLVLETESNQDKATLETIGRITAALIKEDSSTLIFDGQRGIKLEDIQEIMADGGGE